MKAIVQADFGGSQAMHIGEIGTPSPNGNKVLVKVKDLNVLH
jgi:NADPH:quinone reductase-like Zn-dependent oxidoreductase